MVSYDDSFVETSEFEFDDYFLDEPDNENFPFALVEQQVLEAEIVVEDQGDTESEMDLDVDVDAGDHGVAPNEIFNMEPVRQAVQTPIPSRSPSPVSIDLDSDSESDSATLYEPSPPPSRPKRARLAKQPIVCSRSPSPLVERPTSPTPSSYSSTSPEAKVKVEEGARPDKPRRRNSGQGRKGEPRRCQNMIAQKKYRDKKVHASNLMSETIVRLKAALQFAPRKKRLDIFNSIMLEYDASMRDLDPNLASKQDQAVEDQASRYE